jgi:hypothetical protein
MNDIPVHVRTIRMEARKAGERELEVRGTLVDERPGGGARWFTRDEDTEIHNMTVSLHVAWPDLTITRVSARMTTHPYTICPDAVPPLDSLAGLSVARGFNRAVQERIGREKGCAHIAALILAMAPVVKQAASAAFRGGSQAPTGANDFWFIDTCQAWRRDGALHSLLKRGDVAGIKAISTPPKSALPPSLSGERSSTPTEPVE